MRTPPTLASVAANGTQLAIWDWAGAGETLLFAHANGFHGRCWDAVIALLPEYRCVALELRGHGRSDKPGPPADWRPFGEDVATAAGALGLDGAVGVGHSLGGHAVALAAALIPAAFARLVLIDPVVLPQARYQGARPGEHFAARRRERWPDAAAMIARFAPRPPYSRWQPQVLRDYCEYGLLPAPDSDDLMLACSPAFEGAVYQASTATRSDIYAEIATLAQPTLIVRALGAARTAEGGGFDASPTAPDLAAHFPRGRDLPDLDHTHFLPMESPESTAAHIRTALEWVE